MSYEFILAIDPSGSYTEGKGTTGWCVLNVSDNIISVSGNIDANKYSCAEAYWGQHLNLVGEFKKRYKDRFIVVIEDYFLYANKAVEQINSRMETPKVIGVLQYYCWQHHIPYVMQSAAQVKSRWTDEILDYKGYIRKRGNKCYIPGTKQAIDRHCKDAIRHAIHYATFKNKKEEA